MRFTRVWAMPSKNTFNIKPIREFVMRYASEAVLSVDPFAGQSSIATLTNDLNPANPAGYHMEARDFLRMLVERGVRADLVLFDPPYSPRQISECYKAAGLKATMVDTQNSKLMKECKDLIRLLSKRDTVVLSFGWNSAGMGNAWSTEEIMLVAHGGAHNDTICLAERNVWAD